MSVRKFVLTTLAAAVLSAAPALAQVEVEQLNAASAYDTDLLDPGQLGLDSSLWQGTTAARAQNLLSGIGPRSNLASDTLVRAALYSGGVPPQAMDNSDREAYVAARLGAFLRRGDLAAFDTLAEQAGLRRSALAYNKLFTDRALLGGQTDIACAQADQQTIERKAPYWAKLRAYCHFVREENAAAELTMDLLRRGKHEDAGFFNLLDYLLAPKKTNFAPDTIVTPLHISMARSISEPKQISHKILPPILQKDVALDDTQDIDVRLSALTASAHLLSPEQIRQILSSFAATPVENIDALLTAKNWNAAQWGQAYNELQSSTDMQSRAILTQAMLGHASEAGMFTSFANFLASDISLIPASVQAQQDPLLYARLAVRGRDLGMLRELYTALPPDAPARTRIALAADALGGGFLLGELGIDIEARLDSKGAKQSRAVRDTYIAVALGANLSDKALVSLSKASPSKGVHIKPATLLAIRSAAKRGAKAETALRIAALLEDTPIDTLSPDSFAALLFALNEAGMGDFAGQLAAQDFLASPTNP